jgi:hypothetical protein
MLKKVYIILLVASVLSIMLGFLLAGGGHGWVTAIYFSFFPMIISSLIGFGVVKRRKIVLFFIITIYLCVSYVFYFKTLEEWEGYFERVFDGIAGMVILFFASWFTPLLIAVYGLIKKPNRVKNAQVSDTTEVK